MGAMQTRGVLIRGGAVVTVDPAIGTLPRGDVRIIDGMIESVGTELEAGDLDIIDASGMIVMPGLIDTHYHMWSTIGRSFIADGGYGYYPAKLATAHLYEPDDFYVSVLLGLAELANNGVTTVHNWSHNSRSAAHTDAELRAHSEIPLRARYSLGHCEGLPADAINAYDDLSRVQDQWFADGAPLHGLVHLALNLRGMTQSVPGVFHTEMERALARKLAVSIHATQSLPNLDDAVDYERRGYLGPDFLFCHFIGASQADREALARTRTPLTFATWSEMRLTETGDPRAAFMLMRAAGVPISLSSDATSISAPNMFEQMRATWNMAVPWRDTATDGMPPLGFLETIEMATIRGAEALGLGHVTGSLTPGKKADVILIDGNDVNIAPVTHIETAIIQCATPANVDTVIVGGRILKRDKRLVGIDTTRLVSAAKTSAMRIRSAAGGRLAPSSCGCC